MLWGRRKCVSHKVKCALIYWRLLQCVVISIFIFFLIASLMTLRSFKTNTGGWCKHSLFAPLGLLGVCSADFDVLCQWRIRTPNLRPVRQLCEPLHHRLVEVNFVQALFAIHDLLLPPLADRFVFWQRAADGRRGRGLVHRPPVGRRAHVHGLRQRRAGPSVRLQAQAGRPKQFNLIMRGCTVIPRIFFW